MSVISNFGRLSVVGVALLVLPSIVAAQPFTLTGRLVEQFPGGGAIAEPFIALYRATSADPFPTFVANVDPCSPGSSTNCIDGSGAFTIPNLVAATYLLRISGSGMVSKSQSVVVNGDTNLGDVLLIRQPFTIELTVGDIPAAGGSIPVTLRARTTWSIPTLPIVVRVEKILETMFGTTDAALTPTLFNFTWPAGLTDTGAVPFTTLDVSPADPAGGTNCVFVEIRLQSNPQIPLGSAEACNQKRP